MLNNKTSERMFYLCLNDKIIVMKDIKFYPFKENSFYFRNALVRANYSNLDKDIERTNYYL